MRLAELHPTFLVRVDDKHFRQTDSIAEADGIDFLCPVCFAKNGGPAGTHGIICWKPTVPQTTNPTPGRWDFVGTGYDDLTLVAAQSSVFCRTSPRKAHFHVTNGNIV